MNFLEKIGKTIKNWFTGGSSKKTTTTTKKKRENAVKNDVKLQRNVQNQKKEPPKKEEKTEQQKMLELQKKRTEQSKAQLNDTFNKALKPKNAGAIRDEKLKKSTQASKDKAKEKLAELNKGRTLTPRERELKALKNSDPKAIARNILEANKAHPIMSEATRGLVGGASLLGSNGVNKVINKVAAPEIRDAIANVDSNLTKSQKVARTVGELAGTIAPYAATTGLAAKAGKALSETVKPVGQGLELLANSGVVKGIAKATGADAAQLSAKVLTGLQTDLGINLTTGNVQAIIDAINTDGDMGQKIKAYITDQAINMGLGGAIELAPAAALAGKTVAKAALGNKRGYVSIKNGFEDVAEDVQRIVGDDIDVVIRDEDAEFLKTLKNDVVQGKEAPEAYEQVVRETVEKTNQQDAELKAMIESNTDDELAEANRMFAEREADSYRQVDELGEGIRSDAEINKKPAPKSVLSDEEKLDMLPEGTRKARKTLGDTKDISLASKDKLRNKEKLRRKTYGVNGTATSKTAQTAYGSSPHEIEREVVDAIEKNGDFDYEVLTHREIDEMLPKIQADGGRSALEKAKRIVKTGELATIKETVEGGSNAVRKNMAEVTLARNYFGAELNKAVKSGASEQTIKELKENLSYCIRANKQLCNQAGGILEQQRYFAMIDGGQRADVAKQDIIDIFDANKKIRKKLKLKKGKSDNIVATRHAKIYEYINSEAKFESLRKKLDILSEAQGKDAVSKAYSDVIQEAYKFVPMTAMNLQQEIRYLAMLGNFKTHERNLLGTLTFGSMRKASNAVASSLETKLKSGINSKFDVFSKELSAGKLSKDGEAFIEDFCGIRKAAKWDVDRFSSKFPQIREGDYIAINGQPLSEKDVLKRMKNAGDEFKFKNFSGYNGKAFVQAQKKEPTDELGKFSKELYDGARSGLIDVDRFDFKTVANDIEANKAVKFIHGLAKLNGHALNAEDEFFLKRAFRETAYKLAEANHWSEYKSALDKAEKALEGLKQGTKEYREANAAYKAAKVEYDSLVEKIRTKASREALVATFREYNSIAAAMNRIASRMNDPDSPVYKQLAGFGIKAILPFVSTPANVLKQMLRYEPLSIAHGLYRVKSAIKAGDAEMLNKAVDEIGSGGVGILLMIAGYGFAKTGAVTVTAGTDEVAKLKKREGVQNYSVKIKMPNDKEYSFTLDWLTPASTTFFMGAQLNGMGDGSDGNIFSRVGDIDKVLETMVEPLLETSMLSSVKGIVDGIQNNYGNDDRGVIRKVGDSIIESYISSFISTLQGQIARSSYGADLLVTGDTHTEYFINQLKNKAGLGRTDFITDKMGYDTDSFGELKNPRSAVKTAIQLLSPANVQEVKWDKNMDKLVELYEKSAEDGTPEYNLLPRKFYSKDGTISIGKNGGALKKEKIKLTNEEKSLYTRARTTGGADAMKVVLENVPFNRWEKDANGNKQFVEGYSEKEKADLIKQFDGKSARDVFNWVMNNKFFKKATAKEQEKIIATMFNNDGDEAKGNRRSGELAVYTHQGGKEVDYNYKNELSARQQNELGDVNDKMKEAAVEFSRNAGKTYYYTDDEGGHHQTYYNKKEMLEYLAAHPELSEEEKAALYNAFKTWNAKPYGSSGGSGGSGRRRSGGSSKSGSVKVKKPKPPKNLTSKKLPIKKTNFSKTASSADIDALLKSLDAKNKKLVTPPKMK